MKNLAQALDEISARLDAIGPLDEWKDADEWFHDCRVGCSLTEGEYRDDEAANLIANAPTDLRKLIAAVRLANEALKCISGNGENRGMGWTPAQHARIALTSIASLLKPDGGE